MAVLQRYDGCADFEAHCITSLASPEPGAAKASRPDAVLRRLTEVSAEALRELRATATCEVACQRESREGATKAGLRSAAPE